MTRISYTLLMFAFLGGSCKSTNTGSSFKTDNSMGSMQVEMEGAKGPTLLTGFIDNIGQAEGICLAPPKFIDSRGEIAVPLAGPRDLELSSALAPNFLRVEHSESSLQNDINPSELHSLGERTLSPFVKNLSDFPGSDLKKFTMQMASEYQKNIYQSQGTAKIMVSPSVGMTTTPFALTAFGEKVRQQNKEIFESIADKKKAARAVANNTVARCGNIFAVEMVFGNELLVVKGTLSQNFYDRSYLSAPPPADIENIRKVLYDKDNVRFQHAVWTNALTAEEARSISTELKPVEGSTHGYALYCGKNLETWKSCDEQYKAIVGKTLALKTKPTFQYFIQQEYSSSDYESLVGDIPKTSKDAIVQDLSSSHINSIRNQLRSMTALLQHENFLKALYAHDAKLKSYFARMENFRKSRLEQVSKVAKECFATPLDCQKADAQLPSVLFPPDPFVFSRYSGKFKQYCEDSLNISWNEQKEKNIGFSNGEFFPLYQYLSDLKLIQGGLQLEPENIGAICEQLNVYLKDRSSLNLAMKSGDKHGYRLISFYSFLSTLPALRELRINPLSPIKELAFSGVERLSLTRFVQDTDVGSFAYYEKLKSVDFLTDDFGWPNDSIAAVLRAPNVTQVTFGLSQLDPEEENAWDYPIDSIPSMSSSVRVVNLGKAKLDLERYLGYEDHFGDKDCEDVPDREEKFKKMGQPFAKVRHIWEVPEENKVPGFRSDCKELHERFCVPNGYFGKNECK